ncbi:hypothetical protein JTB14_004419 [Gonioctena quinquepunctata]|nr:hypothetical protein JTB14_004419 [Gonioctena quinquepunctata]
MNDRQKRAANIIMLNGNESNNTVHSQRIVEDKNAVKEVLQNIDVPLGNINVFRLGTFQPNKVRPLKVCFSSSNDALVVLKNKKSARVPNVKMFADQTKSQRDYFNKIKTQRNANEEAKKNLLNMSTMFQH